MIQESFGWRRVEIEDFTEKATKEDVVFAAMYIPSSSKIENEENYTHQENHLSLHTFYIMLCGISTNIDFNVNQGK
jgi:hypothetical protein